MSKTEGFWKYCGKGENADKQNCFLLSACFLSFLRLIEAPSDLSSANNFHLDNVKWFATREKGRSKICVNRRLGSACAVRAC